MSLQKFNKVIVGFVSQSCEKNEDGKFVCVGQEFIEGDDVNYEDEFGDELDDEPNEINFVRDMVQPGLDHFVLKMVGCVDPCVVGPFATEKEAQDRVEEYREDPSECQNAHTTFSLTKGAVIDI